MLGADTLGRDVAVRLLYGGRNSLLVGIGSSAICVFFAVVLALLAGYFGGWIDFVITRFFDLFCAFPVVLLGIALGSALAINGFHHFGINIESGSLWIPMLVISYVLIPYVGRPLRGQMLSLREKEFVEASISQGASAAAGHVLELLPNIASSVLVFFTLIIANNIVLEAALSFLGAGVQAPNAVVGQAHRRRARTLHRDARRGSRSRPGIAIVLTVLVAEHLRRRPARRARPARESEGRALTHGRASSSGGIDRRGARAASPSLHRLRDLHRHPRRRPGRAHRGQERDAAEHREHPPRRGASTSRSTSSTAMMMEKIVHRRPVSYTSQQNVIVADHAGDAGDVLADDRRRDHLALLRRSLVGVISAVTAGRLSDRLITVLALIGISMPVFWLGIICRYYLGRGRLEIFPDGEYVPLTENPVQWFYHLILPWFVLAVLFIGFYGRVLRGNILDTINEDYVRTAKAKGLTPRRVMRQARAAQLADPDRDALRPRLRRRARRRRDPHRDRLRPARRRPVRGAVDQQLRPAADHGRDAVRRVLHRRSSA